jgi:hypothetical protein
MKTSIVLDHPSKVDLIARRCKAIFEAHGIHEVIIQDYDQSRSAAQNRLAFQWLKAAVEQLGDETVEEKRAYCKLHFGVQIRREDDGFREVYDRVIRPLTYQQKLEIMVDPIDFPITRDMSVKEMARYLEMMGRHFSELGVDLPKPDDLYRKALLGK